MATLTPVDPDLSGVDPLPYASAAAGGDEFNGRAEMFMMHVINDDASPHEVVIDDPTSREPTGASEFDPDVQIDVPAGGERVSLIRDPHRFQGSDGLVQLSYPSGVTSLTLQIYRI